MDHNIHDPLPKEKIIYKDAAVSSGSVRIQSPLHQNRPIPSKTRSPIPKGKGGKGQSVGKGNLPLFYGGSFVSRDGMKNGAKGSNRIAGFRKPNGSIWSNDKRKEREKRRFIASLCRSDFVLSYLESVVADDNLVRIHQEQVIETEASIYSSGTITTVSIRSQKKRIASVHRGPLTVNLSSLDIITDQLGAASINLATNAERGTEDLQNSSLQLLSERSESHGASDLDDLIERDGLGVLDVLLLLAVTGGLLESLDDERRGGGNDRDGSLTILDRKSDRDAETFLDNEDDRVSKSSDGINTRRRVRASIDAFVRVLTQSTVALAMSSPIFLGDRPKGPTLGARADWAPISPPVHLRWL